MENGPWSSGGMMGDTKAEGEFGQEPNSVEGGADPNYIYGSQPGHNGNAAEGY